MLHTVKLPNNLSVFSFHVWSLYRLFLGVHPVNPTVGIINGNTIGPNHVILHKHLAVRSIQISTLNLGHGASICPVYFAAEKIEINYQLYMYISLWNGTAYQESTTLFYPISALFTMVSGSHKIPVCKQIDVIV